jgi:hypothetical protein
MNFCSAQHAGRLIGEYLATEKRADFACYLKIFYSESSGKAEKNLVSELNRYDHLPQYHRMFLEDGLGDDLKKVQGMPSEEPPRLPDSFRRVALANPTNQEVQEFIRQFRDSGVTLPCLYPYFDSTDSSEFKRKVLSSLFEEL